MIIFEACSDEGNADSWFCLSIQPALRTHEEYMQLVVLTVVSFFVSYFTIQLSRRLGPYGSLVNTYILPHAVNALSSERYQELSRMLHAVFLRPWYRKPTLKLWISCDDPSSFILLQTIEKFVTRWTLNTEVYIMPHNEKELSIVDLKYK